MNIKPSFAFYEVDCFIDGKQNSVAGMFFNN